MTQVTATHAIAPPVIAPAPPAIIIPAVDDAAPLPLLSLNDTAIVKMTQEVWGKFCPLVCSLLQYGKDVGVVGSQCVKRVFWAIRCWFDSLLAVVSDPERSHIDMLWDVILAVDVCDVLHPDATLPDVDLAEGWDAELLDVFQETELKKLDRRWDEVAKAATRVTFDREEAMLLQSRLHRVSTRIQVMTHLLAVLQKCSIVRHCVIEDLCNILRVQRLFSPLTAAAADATVQPSVAHMRLDCLGDTLQMVVDTVTSFTNQCFVAARPRAHEGATTDLSSEAAGICAKWHNHACVIGQIAESIQTKFSKKYQELASCCQAAVAVQDFRTAIYTLDFRFIGDVKLHLSAEKWPKETTSGWVDAWEIEAAKWDHEHAITTRHFVMRIKKEITDESLLLGLVGESWFKAAVSNMMDTQRHLLERTNFIKLMCEDPSVPWATRLQTLVQIFAECVKKKKKQQREELTREPEDEATLDMDVIRAVMASDSQPSVDSGNFFPSTLFDTFDAPHGSVDDDVRAGLFDTAGAVDGSSHDLHNILY